MSEPTLVLIVASPAVLLERVFNEEQDRLPVDVTGVPFLSYAEIAAGDWPPGGNIVSSHCSDSLADFQSHFARTVERNEMSSRFIHRFRYIHFVHVTGSSALVIQDDKHESSAFIDRYLSLYSGNIVEIPESEEPKLPSEWDDSDEVL